MTKDEYYNTLECSNCGQKDDLSHEYSDSGWDKYTCGECGYPFTVPSMNE